MCGRYAAAADPDQLIEIFEVDVDATGDPSRSLLKSPQQPPPGEPDFNLAPGKLAPVVLQRLSGPQRSESQRQLRLLSWGLVPSWAKDPSVGVRMINARVEGIATGKAFAPAAIRRRCLVPATGWYEWQRSPVARTSKGKPRTQPFFITRADAAPLAFAGLYEFWRDPQVPDRDDPLAWVVSYTIITTAAEAGLDRIHDRQPAVLDPEDWAAWLDPEQHDSEAALRALDHAPGRFEAYPVTTRVNAVANNGADLLLPADAGELFGVVDPETSQIVNG